MKQSYEHGIDAKRCTPYKRAQPKTPPGARCCGSTSSRVSKTPRTSSQRSRGRFRGFRRRPGCWAAVSRTCMRARRCSKFYRPHKYALGVPSWGGERRLSTAGAGLPPEQCCFVSCEWVTRGGTWAETSVYFIDFPEMCRRILFERAGLENPSRGCASSFLSTNDGRAVCMQRANLSWPFTAQRRCTPEM